MTRLASLTAFLVLIPAVALAQPAPAAVAPPESTAPPPAEPSTESQKADADRDTAAAVSESAPIAPAPAAPPVVAIATSAPGPAPAPPSAAQVAPPSAAAPLAPVVINEASDPARAGLDGVIADDASSHRAILMGTALTVPAGRMVVDVRQPAAPVGAVGISVGISDRFQVGGSLGYFIDEDGGLYAIGGKLQLVRRPTFALAVTGSLLGTTDDADAEGNALSVGVIASTCLDGPRCVAVLSGHVTALGAFEDDGETVIPVVAGGSMLFGTRSVKGVGELLVTGDEDEDKLFGGYLGFRLPGDRWALDMGLAFAFADDEGDGDSIALPMVGLSSRL